MTDEERNAVLEEAARICEARAAKLRVVNSVSVLKAAGADSCAHYIRKDMRRPSPAISDRQYSFPAGCRHPNSCSRHGECMYLGCPHHGIDRETFGKMVAEASGRKTSDG